MLKKVLVIGLLLQGSVAFAQGGPTPQERAQGAADTRAGLMKMVLLYFGPIYAMAQGQMDYDGPMVERNAHKLMELAGMGVDAYRKDTSEFDLDTEALPTVWEDFDDFSEKMDGFAEAAKALEASGGKGKDEMVAGFRKLGGACRACHDDYRQKK